MFLVDGPVTYLCDTVAGTLMRYHGYAVAGEPGGRRDSHGELLGRGATPSLMAESGPCCARSTYAAGTAERAGLVSLQIIVSAQGESVSLLSQVHVDNVP